MGNIQAFKMRLDKFFAGYLSSPEYTCDFTNGHGSIKGAVKLMSTEKGTVVLNGVLDAGDNTEGMHGFHVHAEGKISPDCTAAGGHFKSNPYQIHGYPNYILPDRHTGDLGNVAVNKGKIEVNIEDTRISLDPTRDDFIGDKAIVIHALQDDGNPTRDPSSTGAAGARVGCCLIQPISYQCDFRAGHGIIKVSSWKSTRIRPFFRVSSISNRKATKFLSAENSPPKTARSPTAIMDSTSTRLETFSRTAQLPVVISKAALTRSTASLTLRRPIVTLEIWEISPSKPARAESTSKTKWSVS